MRKTAAHLSLSILMGMSPLAVMADSVPVNTAPAGLSNPLSPLQGVQGTLGIQSGNYNFTSFDKGALQAFVLKQMADAQEADRQFVLTKTAEIEVAVNALVKDVNGPDGIQTLADTIYAKPSINEEEEKERLNQMLAANRAYTVELQTTLNKLASIKALPSAMPKSEPVSLEGSGVVALRTKGVVDLTEIINFYKSQIDKIDAQVGQIRFNVMLPNGKREVNQKLADILHDIAVLPPLSPEQINKLKDQELSERMISTEMKLKLRAHFLQVKKLVKEYTTDFGTLQKWRVETTKEAKEQILKELENAFWSRSLLRATYGVKLGAIGIQFNTEKFNKEMLFADNELTILSEPVTVQDQINSQRRTLLNAIAVMDKRDQNVLAADTPFFSRILSGLTIVKGQWELAEVNVQVLKLLYADMVEEGIVANEGYQGMRKHYQQRYYTGRTDSEIAEIKARAKDWKNADQADLDTIRGTFKVAETEGDKYLVHLHNAEMLKAQIDTFENSSDIIKKYKQQADDL